MLKDFLFCGTGKDNKRTESSYKVFIVMDVFFFLEKTSPPLHLKNRGICSFCRIQLGFHSEKDRCLITIMFYLTRALTPFGH